MRRNFPNKTYKSSSAAVQQMLRFLETTAVGKRSEAGDRDRLDEWDIDRLNREDGEERVDSVEGG